MMSGEAWLYLLAVLVNAVNLFLQVFFTIMYSDLEWYASLPFLFAISLSLGLFIQLPVAPQSHSSRTVLTRSELAQ